MNPEIKHLRTLLEDLKNDISNDKYRNIMSAFNDALIDTQKTAGTHRTIGIMMTKEVMTERERFFEGFDNPKIKTGTKDE